MAPNKTAVSAVCLALAVSVACDRITTESAVLPGQSIAPQCPTPTPPPPSAPPPTPAVTTTLQVLDAHIRSALKSMEADLPRNPQWSQQYRAKIAMLLCSTLANGIIEGRNYSEASVTSIDGRPIPIVAVFPAGGMRAQAEQAVGFIQLAFPVLEGFMDTAFPPGVIRIWYGFAMGSSGGGGLLNMEDQSTFESRIPSGVPPYQSLLAHELSHSYISHESLDQFLELYVYNVVRTGSPNVESWVFRRDQSASFQGVQALLGVYQVLGRDAMSSAYRAAYPLNCPYGQVLSAQCRQVFVDRAPPDLRAQVASAMATIMY